MRRCADINAGETGTIVSDRILTSGLGECGSKAQKAKLKMHRRGGLEAPDQARETMLLWISTPASLRICRGVAFAASKPTMEARGPGAQGPETVGKGGDADLVGEG